MTPETLKYGNTRRVLGYDIARSLALFGMVFIDFWVLTDADTPCPEWLLSSLRLVQGRSAPLFVVLAGLGLSLLSRAALKNRVSSRIGHVRSMILKRAAFLFISGWLLSLVWRADILHFYAVYFTVGTLLVNVSNRRLWEVAVTVIGIFSVLMIVCEFDRGWEWTGVNFVDFWNLPRLLRHVFFSGLYPVLPWLAFLILGLWLGRKDLSRPSFRKKIYVLGAGAVVAAEFLSWSVFHLSPSKIPSVNLEKILPWFSIDPWEPMPLFLISSGGTALIAVALSVAAAERFEKAPWLSPIAAMGQLTFTLYIGHIILGSMVVGGSKILGVRPWLFPLWGTLLFILAALVFAHQWRKHFQRGPLEWLMRRFLVFSVGR